MNAIDRQVGGSHYKTLPYQPIELAAKLDLDFFQGSIVKYLTRKKESSIQDLQKAKHFAQLAIELKHDTKEVPYDKKSIVVEEVKSFCDMNGVTQMEDLILACCLYGYPKLIIEIDDLCQ